MKLAPIRTAFGLSFSLCCGACLSSEDVEPLSEYAVEGRVTDDLNGHALSGAKVIFVSDTLDRSETRSDGDGHYSMEVETRDGVRFGTLHAELDGYQSSPAQTVYFDGGGRTIDLQLRASGD